MKPCEKKLDKLFRYLHLFNKIYLIFISSNSDKMKSVGFEITLFIYVITQMRKNHLPLLQDK